MSAANLNKFRPRLLNSKPAHKVLNYHFGFEAATTILAETYQEYLNLAPTLPYLEDEPHMNSLPMVESAYFLALSWTLQRRGVLVEAIGKIYYDMFSAFLHAYPKPLRWIYGKNKYNRNYIDRYRNYATETQRRRYPEDFVCRIVESDGEAFDFGYDYTECAILKFFQAHGADELAPYFCYIDFLLAKVFNRGLIRSIALSEGGQRCEFRYKKGRPTDASWPPNFVKQ